MKATGSACLLLLAQSACSGDGAMPDGAGGSSQAAGATSADGSTSGGSASGGAAAGGSDGSGALAGQGGGSTGGGEASGGADAASGGSAADRSSCKRGVAYGYHSEADLAAIARGVSWWYNWAYVPDEALAGGSYLDQDVAYVPMIWGANSNLEGARIDIPQDADWLLAFNEPNFGSQANMSAEQAADLWPDLEEVADARGLDLVSPAVNFCGGDCQNTDPFDYLDDFFAACVDCRVDAIAIHIYVGCNAGGDNHAEWLINHVETYKERFSRPLWLTEFACDDAQNEAEQLAFLEDAVLYLENEPRIARYAWFAGRADNVPHVDLLGGDGELTELGQRYVELDQPAECQR